MVGPNVGCRSDVPGALLDKAIVHTSGAPGDAAAGLFMHHCTQGLLQRPRSIAEAEGCRVLLQPRRSWRRT